MTTNQIKLIIPGKPVAKGRPRFTKAGRTYTDAKTKAAEDNLKQIWKTQNPDLPVHAGSITISMVATFEPAQSWPKWKQDLAVIGDLPHQSKPDLDNLFKILDGLNGVAWVDDCQIISANVRKEYGPVAQTTILIKLHST